MQSLRLGLASAWCPSLDFAGTLLRDRSQLNQHGSLTNMTTAPWIAASAGRVLQFDGNDDYVSFPTTLLPAGNSSLTLACWFNNSGTGSATTPVLFGWGSDTNTRAFPITYFNSSKISFEFGNASGLVTSTTVTATNVWYHVAATYDRANTRMYINGRLEATTSFSTANISPLRATDSAAIGAIGALFSPFGNVSSGSLRRYGTFFGLMDDVRIYGRALTATEIALLASRRGVGLQPVPAREFHFPTTMYRNVGGTWKETTPSVNVGGTWKQATPSVNVGGTWK